MPVEWELIVYENQQPVRTLALSGVADLGRQSSPEELLFSTRKVGDCCRVVIADQHAKAISRHCLRVEPLAGGGFRLTNRSDTRAFRLDDGRQLAPQASCEAASGILLVLASTGLRLRSASALGAVCQLDEATEPPGQGSLLPSLFTEGKTADAPSPAERDRLLRFLSSAVDVLQSAATSSDFFEKATRAMVEMVGLDSGLILLRRDEGWLEKARCTAPSLSGPGRPPSRYLLDLVCRERRTFYEVPDGQLAQAASMRGIEAVVAAPILDQGRQVVAVLYGDRRGDGTKRDHGPISKLDATLVELLARALAAGLARVDHEEKALAAQIPFKQFFSAELAQHLARQPDLLKARDAEISVLFCDIRGFSRISERLSAEDTMNWIGDALDTLSGCVRLHEGVLVDYIGDELIAMWGVPGNQPEHAVLACRAGLAMLASLDELNDRWQATTGEPTNIGIGINTGLARVGNTGSKLKYKYGPLGNTVNLASRVQGATKQVKGRLVVTGATAAKLDDSFVHRRLCQVRVVNIKTPVDLHELAPADQPGWADACQAYGQALTEFERQQFREAAHRLAALRASRPGDGPALVLLSRAVQCMVEEPNPFDPVWELPTK
jgi:adenylate cyclase